MNGSVNYYLKVVMAFMRSELQSTLTVHQSTDVYLFKLQPNPKCIGILIIAYLKYRVPWKVAKWLITHWGRVTHICVSKLTIIGSDNGLSPGRRQAIIWTNADILLIWPLGTNFSGILIEIYIFSFMKMHLKLSSGIWRPFCLGLNVLNTWNNGSVCR